MHARTHIDLKIVQKEEKKRKLKKGNKLIEYKIVKTKRVTNRNER